jgi:outer membrane protein TolC
MNKWLFLIVPALLCADDLKSLLESANTNNKLVVSQTLKEQAKSQELESSKSAYYPTLDLGGYYQGLDEKNAMQSGAVYSGFAKAGFDIYDGGKKSAIKDQKRNEYEASGFDTQALKKSLSLQIVEDFFTIKNIDATLSAKEEAKNSLQAQLVRVQRFYEAKVATKDEVDRLQAAYDTNIYEIESLKLQLLSTKQALELKVAKDISTLEDSNFKEFSQENYESTDSVKSLIAKNKSLQSNAESINSIYYPQFKIEDTYSMYGYENTPNIPGISMVDKQNTILLSANMRIFDNGTVQKNKEAVLLNAQALQSEINYQSDIQKMQYTLAMSRINTGKIKIKSASSALVAASSAYETISEKYETGIVDNVAYLDALSAKTSANALYKTSLNDLEVAYATYYYYAGKNIQEFLK